MKNHIYQNGVLVEREDINQEQQPPRTAPDQPDIFEAVIKMMAVAADTLPDAEALEVATLFSAWTDLIGTEANLGLRVWYDGDLFKCIQPHTIQQDWTPRVTPALWKVVSIEEWPEIPENIPSTAPWMKGDKGTWRGQHYICQLDNCTWNPDQYPAAWKLVA